MDRPNIDAIEHFKKCISGVKDEQVKRALVASEMQVADWVRDYDAAGDSMNLFALPRCQTASATEEEMGKLYKGQMVRKGSPGRGIYDDLILSAKNGVCPFCSLRYVRTLDHYLPKSSFPTLAILPANLVPCCSDCNRDKHDTIPSRAPDQFFHPYFDRIDQVRWLYANVEYISETPTISFRVEAPGSWDEIFSTRINRHFDRLQLGKLYRLQIATDLNSLRKLLRNLLNAGGSSAVRSHLEGELQSYADVDLNSYKAVAYEALMNEPRFMSGEFG